MNPQKLYKLKANEYEETTVYYCSECGTLYGGLKRDLESELERAEQCCSPAICPTCKKENGYKYSRQCDDCRRKEREAKEQERWDEAKKIKLTFPNSDHFYNENTDNFYQDYDAMMEDIFDDFCEFRNDYPLEYCPDAKYIQPRIYLTEDLVFNDLDISEVLTNRYEEYIYEDCDVEDLFDNDSINILYDAVEQFNKLNKNRGLSWQPDYSTGVDISDDIKNTFETEFYNLD
jgi:hypothetical protein